MKERGKVWNYCIGRITNEENDWDHDLDGGAVVCVSRGEMVYVFNEIEAGKANGLSDVSLGLIAASAGVGVQLMAEMC